MKRDLEFVPANDSIRSTLNSRSVWLVALAVVAILAAYWSTAVSVVEIWIRSETFAHGFLVIPVCVWLAWRKREELASSDCVPWLPGLGLVIASGALWLVAAKGGADVVKQFALVFMEQAAIVTIVGLRMARILAFPLAFLLFAVPTGEFLVPTLMDWTADFTVAALRATGVPVYQEANQFVIPSGTWSVVEACSGIRYIIASVMVGAIYAALAFRSPLRRALMIVASILVPIVANWLRAYMIVMLAHLTSNRIATGVDHIIYGWIFFGLVMLLVFWVASFWQESAPAAAVTYVSGGAFTEARPPPRGAAMASAALMAVAGAVVWQPIDAFVGRDVSHGAPTLPSIEARGGWAPSMNAGPAWTPHYEGYATHVRQMFTDGHRDMGVYVAYYRNQAKGRELITSENVLTESGDARWKQVSARSETVDWVGKATMADSVELSGDRDRIQLLRLYWIAGAVTSNPYIAKALQAWTKLTGRGDDAALVVVYASKAAGDRGVTQPDIRGFMAAMSPSIDGALRKAHAAR